MTNPRDYGDVIKNDIIDLCLGKQIGNGAGRDVFEWLPDKTLVAKIEDGSKSFQNIMEWETWGRVGNVAGVHVWFAACHNISACGTVLLQERTSVPAKYPDKVPAWFTDIKKSNFGMVGNKFVCHDYGVHMMIENGMTKRMRKADWERGW